MINVGIESMNVFGGSVCLDVMELANHRKLDYARFKNLLMKEKTVVLPSEDPVTYAVNACKPIIDNLSEQEKNKIELLITCSESGIDFSKSMGTYIHHYLGLNRNCRVFELKQACYAGTAGFQMAVNFILSQASPGAKALVVATDVSRFIMVEGGESLTKDWSYGEPSSGAGAVAMLVSDIPKVFQVDVGANGYYTYEVMDTCRPIPDLEAGDADLSLLSYLDCCEKSFIEYKNRVANVDYSSSFDYLIFHTPFGGMVKGAHRSMMRKNSLSKLKSKEIEEDFTKRVLPGLEYCQRVGNIMGGTIFMALASTIDNAKFNSPVRFGCFSYGSGCCSEFYSGIASPLGKENQKSFAIAEQLNKRYLLTMEEYENLLYGSGQVKFGTRNVTVNDNLLEKVSGNGELLILKEIREFHRMYEWVK